MNEAPKAKSIRIACISCGRALSPIFETEDAAANSAAWDGAMVHDMHAGYGSRHDCGSFIVGICDDCIDAKLSSGAICKFER
jgi:hypothetical protein